MPLTQPLPCRTLLLAALCLLPASADAQTPLAAAVSPAPATPPPWTLSANLAYAQTAGNTSTSAASGGLSFALTAGPWTAASQLQAQRSASQGTVFAESYNANFVAQRKLDDRLSAAFLVWAIRNRFRALDLQLVTGSGLVWSLLGRSDWTFSFTVGAGWELDEVAGSLPSQPGIPLPTGSRDFPVIAMELANQWQTPSGITASQTVYYYADAEKLSNYNVNAILGLKLPVTRRLAVQLSYQWSYDKDPASPAIRKADTAFTSGFAFTLSL